MRTLESSACAAVALLACSAASAAVVRIEVTSREPLAPAAGVPYEVLRGRFIGELDPAAATNRLITDLQFAPRNAHGRVEYTATFAIARPLDAARASGVLVYDVPNRGNGDVAADPDGHVRVISGWQGDLAPRPGLQTIEVPVAHARGGRAIESPAFARFVDFPADSRSLTLGAGLGAPTPRPTPATLDTHRAELFRERASGGPRERIAATDWAFADCRTVPFPGTPDATRVCPRAGFDPAFAYGLVYTAKDPKVLGIGFAATRDLVAFFRSAERDATGTPNPLAGLVKWTLAYGNSQSGNFLRSFVHLGFNADESGRRVFDGINPNIAARHVPLNVRFGVPGGAAGTYEIGSDGPLWWSRYADRTRRRGTASLLDRCTANGTCPKIVETFGSAEFWNLRMSPDLVGTDAKADIPLPSNVRRYYFPGTTHGGSWVGGFPLTGDKPYPGMPTCTLPLNPNPIAPQLRVARRALLAWVTSGAEPPASRYPTIAAGELVAPTSAAMGWRAIPGAASPDGKLNELPDYDVGANFRYGDVSGVTTRLPPRSRGTVPQLVPRVDADGNETSGVPSVHHRVPIGTYTGWNEMATGYDKGGNCGLAGGFVPFARTRAEREATGDARPSLQERYGDHAGFVARVREVAAQEVAAGWLLPDDAAKIVADAEASDVLR